MSTFQIFLNTITAVGVIIYAIAQVRNGRSKKESDALASANGTIDLLTKRADAFSAELETMKKLHRDNEINIAKLEEASKHKDLLLEQYLKIITNRNPELENTLKEVRNFLEELNKKIGNGTTLHA